MADQRFKKQRKNKRQGNRQSVFYSAAAIAGLLGIMADFLIGYVEPGSSGLFGMAQTGWETLPLWRPMVSMLMLSVIFPAYILAVLVLSRDIEKQSPRMGNLLRVTMLISCPGWMLVHGLFSIPQYVYAYLHQTGNSGLASEISDAILTIAAPSLIITFIFMAFALIILMMAIASGQTRFPRHFAFFNPLVVAAITLPLMQIFPGSALVLGLSMGTMHWGMLLFFAFAAWHEHKRNTSPYR